MELEGIDKIYDKHAKFYDLTRKFFLFNRRKAVKKLELKKNDDILDLACGTGLNIPLLLNIAHPKNIIGIDYSTAMLEKARKKYPYIRFVQGDVSTYNFPYKFDKIICTYSLSMIEEWEKTIANAKNHLKENGIFVVLDFYKWRGVIKAGYPMFRNLLGKFGVNPEKNLESCLKENFQEVEIKILNSGYNFTAAARGSGNV